MPRRIAEAAATILFCAAPIAAAAQIVPADRQAAIADARTAVSRGDHAAAIARLEGARAAFPNDPELLRLLGSTYAYARRYPEAIATLRRARALAPEDPDIRAALARAYLWSGDRDAARSELAAIEARDATNAELSAIRNQLAREDGKPIRPRRGLFANQGIARVSLDNGPDRTWGSTTVGAFGEVAGGTTLSFEGEREDRGTAIDTRLIARVDQRFSQSWRGHVAVAATPQADFREQWSIQGGLEMDVNRHLTLLADARHADYGNIQVTAVEPGVRLGAPALRSSATLRMINLWDEQGTHRSGWSARIDTETRGGTALFGGVATYPDTEAGITRRARSAFLGAAIPVSDQVTIRATGEYERRVESYTRKAVFLGLQLRL